MEHACKMKAVCAEIKRAKKEAKLEFKALSDHEKQERRLYRTTLVDRTDQSIQENAKEDDMLFQVWDTNHAPRNIFEIEAAMELPFSKKLWLQNKK